MNVYDFFVANKETLDNIDFNQDGSIEVDPEDFGFGDPELTMDVEKHQMVFEVPVGNFRLRTRVWIENFSEAVEHLKKIGDLDKRQEVIELIEEHYRDDAQLEYEMAQEDVVESTARMEDRKKDFDLVVDTLRDIKDAWQIQ